MDGRAAIYIVKAMRLLLVWFAATVGARLFESDYIEKVYGRGERPPALTTLVAWVTAAVLLFNTILLGGLALVSGPTAGFSLITSNYVSRVALDGLMHVGLLAGLGAIVTSIVENRKYFEYRTEGARAIRATKELILAVSTPFITLPVFIFS